MNPNTQKPASLPNNKTYRGRIFISPVRFSGWVVTDPDDPIEMRVTDDTGTREFWRGICDDFRAGRKNGNKNCGFSFNLRGHDLQSVERLRMFDAGSGDELPFSGLVIPDHMKKWIDRLRTLSHFPFLHSATIENTEGEITSRIFYAGDTEPDVAPPLFLENANGTFPIEPEQLKVASDPGRDGYNYGNKFWFARSFPNTTYDIDLTEAFANPLIDNTGTPYVNLKVQHQGKSRPLIDTNAIGMLNKSAYKFPPAENFDRVAAHSNLVQKFTTEAFLCYRAYREVYETYAQKPWAEIGAMLDWGCGCGRVTQPVMSSLGKNRVWGTDIDVGNVQWCLDNLQSSNFRPCQTKPPLPFEDHAFDYIIATSVLTHIPEDLVEPWVCELARVLKPGGLAALTVGSDTRVAFGAYDWDRLDALEARGIEDHVKNVQLDGIIDDDDYYRNVRMTKNYIRQVWGKHLDILDILDHDIGVQDMVICQKRR